MCKEKFLEYYESHKGEVIGAGAGLVFAVSVLLFGFWRMIFIVVCACIGFYVGKKFFDNKNFFRELYAKVIKFFKTK